MAWLEEISLEGTFCIWQSKGSLDGSHCSEFRALLLKDSWFSPQVTSRRNPPFSLCSLQRGHCCPSHTSSPSPFGSFQMTLFLSLFHVHLTCLFGTKSSIMYPRLGLDVKSSFLPLPSTSLTRLTKVRGPHQVPACYQLHPKGHISVLPHVSRELVYVVS